MEVLENTPVTYNNGTDIDHLQSVLDYKTELHTLWHHINHIDHEMKLLENDIIDMLTTIDFPADKKIPVHHDGIVQLNFWYDEDGYVDYELAV